MDLDEWEFLPDSKSFSEFGHEGGGNQLLCKELSFDDNLVLEMNYFICPSKSTAPRRYVGAEDSSGEDHRSRAPELAVADKEFKDIAVVVPPPMILDSSGVVSQVPFKKMEEENFADVKVTSPKSLRGGFAVPFPEPEPIQLRFGEAEEEIYDLDQEVKKKPSKGMALEGAKDKEDKNSEEPDMKNDHDWETNGSSTCRWKMTRAGVLCSIGVAAAAVCCIFVLGGGQGQKQQHRHQKIQFQIYADEKRIKRAVHQATRLKQALSAVRGTPMTRARISFGGYYEGL